MSDEPPKINLIYVASIGRSGTTLFETMLGAHSQVETIGEVHLWPHEILQGGVRPCGSGLYVQECPFWQEMRSRVAPLQQSPPQIHHFREQHNAGRTLRLKRLRDFTSGSLPGKTTRTIATYAENNYALFSAFLDLVEDHTGTRPKWVVDASKDPYRLLWLLRSGRFNLKVFHLVKHPYGFAYSVTRNWIEQTGWRSHLARLYYTTRQSGAWVTQNLLFSLIARNHLVDADYELIRYEDLATHPQATFRRACARVGLPYQEAAVSDWRSGSQFTIAGNPMRYEDRDIELDERWKHHLPLSSRILTSLITALSKSSYHY
jgi:hypothetical protein